MIPTTPRQPRTKDFTFTPVKDGSESCPPTPEPGRSGRSSPVAAEYYAGEWSRAVSPVRGAIAASRPPGFGPLMNMLSGTQSTGIEGILPMSVANAGIPQISPDKPEETLYIKAANAREQRESYCLVVGGHTYAKSLPVDGPNVVPPRPVVTAPSSRAQSPKPEEMDISSLSPRRQPHASPLPTSKSPVQPAPQPTPMEEADGGVMSLVVKASSPSATAANEKLQSTTSASSPVAPTVSQSSPTAAVASTSTAAIAPKSPRTTGQLPAVPKSPSVTTTTANVTPPTDPVKHPAPTSVPSVAPVQPQSTATSSAVSPVPMDKSPQKSPRPLSPEAQSPAVAADHVPSSLSPTTSAPSLHPPVLANHPLAETSPSPASASAVATEPKPIDRTGDVCSPSAGVAGASAASPQPAKSKEVPSVEPQITVEPATSDAAAPQVPGASKKGTV